MSHFAKVENGIVTQVIVAEQDVIDSGLFGDPQLWLQCSYNTRGGVHYLPNSDTPSPDQSKALRKNFPGIGTTYDAQRDAFYGPKLFPSWVFNEETCCYDPPLPLPEDAKYGFGFVWDEPTRSWVINTMFGLPPDANVLKITFPYEGPK